MSTLYVGMIAAIHILVCGFLQVIKKYKEQMGDNIFAIMLLVPVAGPACAMVLLVENKLKRRGCRRIDIFDSDAPMDKYSRIHSCDEDIECVVPLDEAVELNSPSLRHKLMFDVLWKNPDQYISTLIKAENSNDMEVTHYATTMVNEIVTEYEKKIHSLEKKYINTGDISILRDCLFCMDEFINSGLHDGRIQEIHERKLQELIVEYKNHSKGRLPGKIMFISIKTLLKLGENNMALKELAEADKRYDCDERLLALWGEYYYNIGDAIDMKRMCEKLKAKGFYMSRKGKKWFEFWDGTCES